jgi:hypothetical protein
MEGLEPPHLAASDPKSDVSTNFTTSGGLNQIPKIKFRFPVSRGLISSLWNFYFWVAKVGLFSFARARMQFKSPNSKNRQISFL